ncbi:hypothetical protein MalM25_13860 [Planctomycetes bacterium MalM25]|nr:hypothetical protein MalM25_13860 [Planctomycetes bacterium MalM25]
MRIAKRTDSTPEPRARGWLAVALCLVAGIAQAQPLTPLRLQVSIKSGDQEKPLAWRGDLAVSEGRLDKLQPLNLDPNAAAALAIQEGRLRVRHRRPLPRDVFNVTALRSPGGELLITPLASDGEPSEPVRVSLDAALSAPQTVSVGEGDALFTIARVANDRMRIETDRRSLLFDPGEEFTFDLLAEPAGVERGRPYDLTATLLRGRGAEEVWRGATTRVEAPAIGAARLPVAMPLPEGEGVYTVRLAATRPPGFLSRFPRSGTPPVIAERTFQIAVFDASRSPTAPTAWNETHAFEPGATNWVRRVPEWMRWRRLPWPQAGPLSSEEGAPPETVSPRASDGSVHWRAYPLPIEQPGALYAVEVQYEGEPEEALTMALVEPDALGDLRPIGRAVTRPARRWNRGAGAVVMQLTARPRTASPMLVLANPSETAAARFGRIRLLRATEGPAAEPAQERLVALDWSEADLPHALGASHAASPIGRFEQPDLQTHYETAVALADRVLIAGANAALITVNERGGAIYPSESWSTPRFDLGCWADGAGDLPRRELLSLIAQEFRRRGLRLVLGLRFDSAIPSLETPDSPPLYAPTDARTLAAQEAALAEALDAVGDPGVVAGVAVRIASDDWSLLGRHERGATDPGLSDRLRGGYGLLAESLNRRLPVTFPLLLIPGELAEHTALAPRLGGTSPAAMEYLQRLGLSAVAQNNPLLRVVSPWGGTSGPESSPRSPVAASLETLRESLPHTGPPPAISIRSDRHTLRLRRSAERLRASNGSKPPSDLKLEAWIADPIAEGELLAAAAGQATSVVLASGPATAGWRDSAVGERRAELVRTPQPSTVREPSELAGGDIGAIAFDTGAESSVALATNHTPWSRRARLTLATPTRMRGERLGAGSLSDAEWFEPGQYPVELTLAPHQTIGWRFDGAGVQVVGLRIEPSPDAEEELTAVVADLQSRDTTTRRPFEALPNASFESVKENEENGAGGPFVGWSASRGVSQDAEVAFVGESSARLVSALSSPSVLTSEPFPMPTTGQLVLGFRVRPGELDPDAELRIELEQVDGDYRNATKLLASQLIPAGGEGEPSDWLPPIVFPIDDLPLLADGRLRLRLTLTGEGAVNLDDLQAEDLILPLDGYGSIELRAEKFALIRLLSATDELLSEGRLGACRELLDGYWARFLVDHFPPHQPEAAHVAEDASREEADEEQPVEEAESPSVSQRLKGYLPRWWR